MNFDFGVSMIPTVQLTTLTAVLQGSALDRQTHQPSQRFPQMVEEQLLTP